MKLRRIVLSLLAMSAVLYLIFLFPPLTSGSGLLFQGTTQEELAAGIRAERVFCEAEVDGVDCACFALKSGIVKTTTGQRIPDMVYADQDTLARLQASESC